jgi:hypothetical protein
MKQFEQLAGQFSTGVQALLALTGEARTPAIGGLLKLFCARSLSQLLNARALAPP